MKRYGIFRIIGDGSQEDPYRSEAGDVPNARAKSLIPSKPSGEPKYLFSLDRVATQTLSSIATLTNSFVFPDFTLDAEISGIQSATLTALKQSVEAYDWDGGGFNLDVDISDTSISYESLMFSIYQQIEPTISLAQFLNTDIQEPE